MVAPFVALTLLLAACGGDDDDSATKKETSGGQGKNTGKIDVLNAMEPEEASAIQPILDEQLKDKDYKAELEASGDFEQQFKIRSKGGTLDAAMVPQPGTVREQAKAGNIVALEDLGIDVSQLNKLFGEYFVSLGEYNGKHYGLPTNINLKSMIWYPKKAFDAAGYKVPKTWDELLALSDQIVKDGSTPWCVGFESEGSSGWPATDWLEDIMLRTAGTDTYDKWVNHEIPFNDQSVKHAAELFGDVMFKKGYVLGGADQTPSIAFGDAPKPMFEKKPKCWLHRQASFINAFFPKGTKAGVDYDWFPFPKIDKDGTLFGGEFMVVGTKGNRPEVADFIKNFMAKDIQCAMGGVAASSRISPNVEVGSDCYANKILADASTVLTAALKNGTGRFDASDMMPAAVGSGSEWSGMLDYMKGGKGSLDGVLDKIESSWPSS
jgi:alpha-glucoside transport system substrate-binding protein